MTITLDGIPRVVVGIIFLWAGLEKVFGPEPFDAAAEQGHRSLAASKRQAEDAIGQARDRSSEILAQAEKRAAQMIESIKRQL